MCSLVTRSCCISLETRLALNSEYIGPFYYFFCVILLSLLMFPADWLMFKQLHKRCVWKISCSVYIFAGWWPVCRCDEQKSSVQKHSSLLKKATKWMKRDRKFNNNKFSFKARQKNLSKSTKMFKISQTWFAAWPHVRINYSSKSESLSFSHKFCSYFIGCGFAYRAKSWIQLRTNNVHYHFCFLKSRQLL